jgi:hypothetical protein
MAVVRNQFVSQLFALCGWLAALLAVAFVVSAPLACLLQGGIGVAAAAAAAACVFVSSALGLVVGELFRKSDDALLAMVLGMVIRMSLPLAACVVVQLSGGSLASAGFVFYVLFFYMVGLAVDTCLLVRQLHHKRN